MPYWIHNAIATVLNSGPTWLVWIGGVVFAGMKWKQHQRVAMFVVIACGGSIVASGIFTAISWLIGQLMRHSSSWELLSWIGTGFGFLHSVMLAAAFAVLVYAAFLDRPEAAAS